MLCMTGLYAASKVTRKIQCATHICGLKFSGKRQNE